MAVTQADIDALNDAIKAGVRQVTLPGGQTTTYNTTASLIAARDDMVRQMQNAVPAPSGAPRSRVFVTVYNGRNA